MLSEKLGVKIPAILLPSKDIDLTKWAVVACDQYTSQPEYWEKVEGIVGDDKSTLHLIFPEVYLEKEGKAERIEKINGVMRSYLSDDTLSSLKPGFIYVDRKTTHAGSRKGLILAVDLEKYDYNKGSQTLIRATEGTVLERIPPRVKVRENASIELPHIMLLIDDPEKTVIEPLAAKSAELAKLYDFELMMSGGHIKGYKVDDEVMVSNLLAALAKIAEPEVFKTKYGVGDDKGVLLFAVGDGNHSLATAKACWVNIKQGLSEDEIIDHPARFALVEVVNVHDDGLVFEPIHRVMFNVNSKTLLDEMIAYYKKNGITASYEMFDTKEAADVKVASLDAGCNLHVIKYVSKDGFGVIIVEKPKHTLVVGTLQNFIDDFLSNNNAAQVDYIHGDDVVESLGAKEGNIGFYLPAMDKNDLFKTVIVDGVLPRKTFSMGEAEEKRFYLECRKIVRD